MVIIRDASQCSTTQSVLLLRDTFEGLLLWCTSHLLITACDTHTHTKRGRRVGGTRVGGLKMQLPFTRTQT